MTRRVWRFGSAVGLLLSIAGCGLFERPERPAWRGRAESVCLARKLVQPSEFVRPEPPIDGPGICGLEYPFRVTALAGGTVALNAPETIGCPLTAALDRWVVEMVQPAARVQFGVPVTRIDSLGSYACRPIDNQWDEKLSEHAFGNAIDISGFELADGHTITFVRDWNGPDRRVQDFLRDVQAGACMIFTTVLAPGADRFHFNHMHVDLAWHGNTPTGPRRYCEPHPSPQLLAMLAERSELGPVASRDENLDTVQAGSGGSLPPTLALHSFDPAAPTTSITASRSELLSAPGLAASSLAPPASIPAPGASAPD